jgi:hypothetical protein
MNAPNNKRKIRAVLIAAIVGAALFDAMILGANLIYVLRIHGHINDFWYDQFTGIGFLLEMPSSFVSSLVGFNGFLNEYLVNGLLGAIVFAVITTFWQLRKKGEPKN